MSTVAYAQLTNKRDLAVPNTSTTQSPGIGKYADALSALVPAEVLSLHALAVSAATTTTPDKVTVINDMPTLAWTFWGLIALSVAFYAVPRYVWGGWDRLDLIRVLIPPFAFAGWTMLQRVTAFDAAFPTVPQIPRTIIAFFIAVIFSALAFTLAYQADQKPAPQA